MPYIQPIHLILILIIALVIFGPSRLPELGRSLGRSITEFKDATKDLGKPIEDLNGRAATPLAPAQPEQPAPAAPKEG